MTTPYLLAAVLMSLVLSLLACIGPVELDPDDGVCDEGETHTWRCSPDKAQRVKCDNGAISAEPCSSATWCYRAREDGEAACMTRSLGAVCDPSKGKPCSAGYHCENGLCLQLCQMDFQCPVHKTYCRRSDDGAVNLCSARLEPEEQQMPGSGCCKYCSSGKACGDSCIASNKSCNVGGGCACN